MSSTLLRRRSHLAGLALLAGVMVFLVLERAAEASYPGFDAASQPLSRLGNSDAPTRWLWTVGLVALAGSWLVATATMIRSGAGRATSALNLAPTAGLVVAVAIPLDVNLAVHEVAAFGAFVLGILAMLVNAPRLRRPWSLVTLGTAGLAVVALSPVSGLIVGVVGWGKLERLVVAPLIGSLIAFGLALLFDGCASPALPHSRRSLLVPAAALLLALAGVGSGLTAGGTSVVAAELSRHIPPNLPSPLR